MFGLRAANSIAKL